jgi:DNA-binding response OmpR family regulator
MSSVRLDQILLRRGLVSEEQIKQALLRQRSHGGRLGSHLFYYRFLSEEQLVNALAEQLGVPGVMLSETAVPAEVAQKVPAKLVDKFQVLPFAFDPVSLSLSIAVVDPDNKEALEQIKNVSGAREIKQFVAVDSVLRGKIARHYHGSTGDPSGRQVIELPDLFEEDRNLGELAEAQPADHGDKAAEPLNVLMVTEAAFLRNVLSSIFEREGYNLQVLSKPDHIARAMGERTFDYVLVSQDMEERFSRWIQEGVIPQPHAEVSLFSSICGSLLDNPAPYLMMVESLIRSLQTLSEYRCAKSAWKPPYARMCHDVRDLGHALGLRRIAVDGLQIISSILIPADKNGGDDPDPALRFEESDGLRASMACIHFPWDIEGCISSLFHLLKGTSGADRCAERRQEMVLGPQILAAVWYRYFIADGIEGNGEAIAEAATSLMREREGQLFSSEVLETYIRILEQDKREGSRWLQNDIFMVSGASEIATQFSAALRKAGFRIVVIDNLAEAKRLYERQRPDIIVVNFDSYPNQAMKFSRLVRSDSKTLTYAITTESKASLIVSLLDSGFSDVFTPPFNYDIIAVRMSKSLAILSELTAASGTYRGFSGTFQELPLINLIQALGMSQRDVRIALESDEGKAAEIYLRKGQMAYAKYGDVCGVDAIYKIIAWGDRGSFSIEHARDFPPSNISLPNDFIIMEGCRQLDEEKL